MSIRPESEANLKSAKTSSISNLKNFVTNDTNISVPLPTSTSKEKEMSKTNYLDYTFLSHRLSLLGTNTKSKKSKEYVFDLLQTLKLTMDILPKALTSSPKMTEEQKDSLLELYNTFKSLCEIKNSKRNDKINITSKNLIETQILEEVKRKMEENSEYYHDQIKENEENVENKIEYAKIFEKKLYEVEIYIQKNTRNLVNSKYEIYKNWKMNSFLDVNCGLMRKKELLKKDIVNIKEAMEQLKKDSQKCKEEIKEDESELTSKDDKKVKEYIEKYRKNILVIESRMKILRNSYRKLSTTLEYLSLDRRDREGKKETSKETLPTKNIQTTNIDKECPDKSILPLDMTRKINNFMDFSIILNKKMDETNFNDLGKTLQGNLGNVTNINMWDISCINKN